MTDPLQSCDLLRRKYDAELQEIELLPPANIELPADQALALVILIQLGAADRSVEHNPLLPSRRQKRLGPRPYFPNDQDHF